jgi:hypothetical protein
MVRAQTQDQDEVGKQTYCYNSVSDYTQPTSLTSNDNRIARTMQCDGRAANSRLRRQHSSQRCKFTEQLRTTNRYESESIGYSYMQCNTHCAQIVARFLPPLFTVARGSCACAPIPLKSHSSLWTFFLGRSLTRGASKNRQINGMRSK